MDVYSLNANEATVQPELEKLRSHSGWFVLLGGLMLAVGIFAIGWSCVTTITVMATWLFGFFLLGTGLLEALNAFFVGRWRGTLLHLLLGVFYTIAGFLIIDQPAEAAIKLTMLIAVFLMISGAFRVVFAIAERFSGWAWVLVNGLITFYLGLLIYKEWPSSGLWVIGLFLGIDLILNGWTWIMLGLGLRRLPPAEQAATVS